MTHSSCKSQIKKTIKMLLAVLFFCRPVAAMADNCSGYTGYTSLGSCSQAGEWQYDSTNATYKYCNGTHYVSMAGTATATACTQAGDFRISGGANQFCNGSVWVDIPLQKINGYCSVTSSDPTLAGRMEYNTTTNTLDQCMGTTNTDADNWYIMNKPGPDGPGGGFVTGKCVFVTSTFYQGNLGGVAGADALCQGRATAAGLGGTYKAWLSSSNPNDPGSSFTKSTTPYIRLDGAIIANDWTDLTDLSDLNAAINVTEYGTQVSPSGGWCRTYACTLSNGNYCGLGAAYTCNGWTDSTATYSSRASNCQAVNDGSWSNGFSGGLVHDCNNSARLMCFEQ
ncbi:MAG: hypothetical protein HYU57_00745 [Micavibrio aeruginosavorus]|nr:hypothetical protein [Micavibrio aeruginosavorus]